MNKRQQKKRLKKALDILNDIELIDSDYDSGSVLYVSIEGDENNRSMLAEFCGLLGIDKKKLISACVEDADPGYLDLINIWLFCSELKGYAICHGYKSGFVLKAWNEEDD